MKRQIGDVQNAMNLQPIYVFTVYMKMGMLIVKSTKMDMVVMKNISCQLLIPHERVNVGTMDQMRNLIFGC